MAINAKDIHQTIIDGFDFTVDEGSNTFIALRKVKWSENGSPRLDLRKYMIDSNGNEVIQKGVGFITEEGPHELARVLVEQGYGHTDELLKSLVNRDDFKPSLITILDKSQFDDIDLDAIPGGSDDLEDGFEDDNSDETYDVEEAVS